MPPSRRHAPATAGPSAEEIVWEGVPSIKAMVVEIGDRSRLAALFKIVGRGVGVEMHGEQTPANQVWLHRLAQTQRHVGLAHAEVQFVVGQQQPLPARLALARVREQGVGRLPVVTEVFLHAQTGRLDH